MKRQSHWAKALFHSRNDFLFLSFFDCFGCTGLVYVGSLGLPCLFLVPSTTTTKNGAGGGQIGCVGGVGWEIQWESSRLSAFRRDRW